MRTVMVILFVIACLIMVLAAPAPATTAQSVVSPMATPTMGLPPWLPTTGHASAVELSSFTAR